MKLTPEQIAEIQEMAKAAAIAIAPAGGNGSTPPAGGNGAGGSPASTPPDPAYKAIEEKVVAQSAMLEKLLKYMTEVPAVRGAGYFTEDGGSADPSVKSFGDFLLAVKRGDVKRITEIYKSRAVAWKDAVVSLKDVQLQPGTAGGYLVPDEFHPRLLELTAPMTVVRQRATVIPVSSDAGRIPALDQYTAPTAGVGRSAFAGGVVAGWTAPGGTLGETQPTFAQVEYTIRKLGGFTEVENEVLADSAIGLEALLSRLFAQTKAALEDYAFLRGTGAGMPLGILNGAAAIGVTPATNNVFGYADALTMRSRFKISGGKPVWILHPGVIPDVGVFEVSAGSGGVWIANLAGALPDNILGWPFLESEHLPQDDNSGDVILADLTAYVIFDRQEMAVAYSEHAAFTADKATWRFTSRLDGQPWVRGAVTLADPQGSYTVSPFVYHND